MRSGELGRHEGLGWGIAARPATMLKTRKSQVPCGKIFTKISFKSACVSTFMPVEAYGQLKVRETTWLQARETRMSFDWAPGALAKDSPNSGKNTLGAQRAYVLSKLSLSPSTLPRLSFKSASSTCCCARMR